MEPTPSNPQCHSFIELPQLLTSREAVLFLLVGMMMNCHYKLSWYSDRLRAGRPRGRSSSPVTVKNVHFFTSGTHTTSYPLVTGTPSLGVKRQGREVDHTHPTSSKGEDNLIGSIDPRSHTLSWRSA
jgi:hypothetical protein